MARPAKLTEHQVYNIRKARAAGAKLFDLANEYSTTHVTIGKILKFKSPYNYTIDEETGFLEDVVQDAPA